MPSVGLPFFPRNGGVPVNGPNDNILYQRALIRLAFLITPIRIVQALSRVDEA